MMQLGAATDETGELIGCDVLVDTDPGQGVDDADELRAAMACLPLRYRQILRMRFFEYMTQEEIGRRFGITQTEISRELAKIMRQVRAMVKLKRRSSSGGVHALAG